MKKILISALLVMFLLIAFENVKACDPGYTESSVLINYNGCEFTLFFCYQLTPLGTIHIKYSYITGPECILTIGNNPYIWNLMNDKIFYKLLELNFFPPCNGSGAPPAILCVIERALCGKYSYISDPNCMSMSPCPNTQGKCIKHYKVCADYSTTSPILNKEFLYSTVEATSDCPSVPFIWTPEGDYSQYFHKTMNSAPGVMETDCYLFDCE